MRYDVLPIVRDSPLYEGCCVYILFSYSPTMSLQLQLCSMVDWQASQRVHRSTLSDLCQKMSDVTRTVSVLWAWLVVSCPVVVRGPRIDDLTCFKAVSVHVPNNYIKVSAYLAFVLSSSARPSRARPSTHNSTTTSSISQTSSYHIMPLILSKVYIYIA